MTRLTSQDISGVSSALLEYDDDLHCKTGLHLLELACRAAGITCEAAARLIPKHPVGVVSMTCGLGVIGGFGQTLAHISTFLGFEVILADRTDAAGLAEVVEQGARITLTSDDDCYLAVNLEDRRVIHNSPATGRGFAVALDAMAGGLAGKSALVVGCGPVGQAAVELLSAAGADVWLNDLNGQLARDVAGRTGCQVAGDLESALKEHHYIVDATTAADIIREAHLNEESYVAAPGVPLGVEAAAYEHHQDRIIHDPLQIGTAVMLLDALNGID